MSIDCTVDPDNQTIILPASFLNTLALGEHSFEAYFTEPDSGSARASFKIVEESEEDTTFSEGCLSLPGISENVIRPASITIRYMDENFTEHTETYDGFAARIIQHEYDHLEGHVFTDRISPIRRQFVKTKLTNIAKGKVVARYRTKR